MPIAGPALDLPLAGTPSSRFLTWMLAGLVGVAVLAFAVAAGADVALRRYAEQPRLVTVALPAATDAAVDEAETRRALDLLRTTPGVAYATLVSREELDKLVEPWLGPRGEGTASLPMPRLIDVGFNPGVTPDVDRLAQAVRPINAGAQVEDADPGPDAGEHAARVVRLLAGTAGLVMLLAILAAVVVVTRMSLDLHAETVDLLRLMGARDRYVARQFEQHALASGLRGGIAGFGTGLLLVVAFILIGTGLPGLGLPGLPLRTADWVLLACVPVLGALLTALAARLSAAHGLRRLR